MAGIMTRVRAVAAALLAALLVACGGGDQASPGGQDAAGLRKASVADFTGNGTWWQPTASGTGFFFEAQGGLGVVTFYMFEDNGKPVWYSAVGPLTANADGTFDFSGTLQRFSGGQSDKSTVQKTPVAKAMGNVSIRFGFETAFVQLPQRSFTASKFYELGIGFPATEIQPETGIYWNPAESGRGFTIEVNSNLAAVTVFHYDEAGEPTWHLVTGAAIPTVTELRDYNFMSFFGGQTLSGAHKLPSSRVDGTFKMLLREPCTAMLAFAGMPVASVKRFAFGTLPAGHECRFSQVTKPVVTYFNDVTLTLHSPTKFDGSSLLKTDTGQSFIHGSFSISASGNIQSLAGKTIYAVIEDPGGFFAKPSIRLHPAGATLTAVSNILERGRKYQGYMRLYACLDPTCGTQIKGSPMSIPYNFTVP
jgi:hypothetical protein